MTVALFPRHRLYRCGSIIPCPGCRFCDGYLSWCPTCGGAEGDLPSECPQERMHQEEVVAVRNGHLDFLGGRWVCVSEEAKKALDLPPVMN